MLTTFQLGRASSHLIPKSPETSTKMEGLRKLAQRSFEKDQCFKQPLEAYDVIQLLSVDNREVLSHRTTIPVEGLCGFLRDGCSKDDNEQVEGNRFRLVRIPRYSDKRGAPLQISKHVFTGLLDEMRVDPWVQQLIAQDSYGFHFVGENDKTRISTLFVGTMSYKFVWTIESRCQHSTTKVLLFVRSDDQPVADELYSQFLDILAAHSPGTPYPVLLNLTIATQILYRKGRRLREQHNTLTFIERQTGHGFFHFDSLQIDDPQAQAEAECQSAPAPQPVRFDINRLIEWSREVGRHSVRNANAIRNSGVIDELLSFITDPDQHNTTSTALTLNYPDQTRKDLVHGIHLLSKRSRLLTDAVKYLEDRARNQSSVVSEIAVRVLIPDFPPIHANSLRQRYSRCSHTKTRWPTSPWQTRAPNLPVPARKTAR